MFLEIHESSFAFQASFQLWVALGSGVLLFSQLLSLTHFVWCWEMETKVDSHVMFFLIFADTVMEVLVNWYIICLAKYVCTVLYTIRPPNTKPRAGILSNILAKGASNF